MRVLWDLIELWILKPLNPSLSRIHHNKIYETTLCDNYDDGDAILTE